MKPRLYTLYKRPRGAAPGTKWIHMGYSAMGREYAIRFFQSALIANAIHQLEPDFEYRLRPVKLM